MAVNCSWKGSIRPPPGEVSNPHGLHESLKVVTLGQLELAAHLHRGNLSFVTYSGQSRSSHLSIFGHKFKHTEVTGGGNEKSSFETHLVSHIALMEDLKQSEKEMFVKMLTASFQSAWERLSMFETISALLELSVETSCWTKSAVPVVTKWAVPAV